MASLSSILSGSASLVSTKSTGSLAASVTSLAATALSSTFATATSSALSIPTSLNSGNGTTGTSEASTDTSDKGKIVGLSLAIGSGLLIGSSFVFKKKGLINCTKNGMLAGEGHAYLKSTMWWSGMLMMVVGEVFNFVAYAFVQPILVTPLGALSVVICAILSSIFLRERLSMQGKVGCAQCIVGATIIVLHAPEQTAVTTIQEFKHYMIQPIFLTWMALIIIASLLLIFKAGPRWGKEHMMIYIGVCSLIGSLSVVSTQGLGAAIVHNISTGESQFDNWFIYFVIVFMVVTLLTEINYLNKALNLFNTAMVTPTYYVTFTSTTIITSAILYQGFAASVVSILTVCLGFLVICGGVLLLQTSKPVVPLHIPGSSTAGIVVGTITYDDIEPTAADMRASPFSSIRRITRDFSSGNRPSPSVVGHSSVFQSSPLNPRAESLLQRKRRASNAAAQQAHAQALAQAQANGHLRSSRPVSMISNNGLLTVPSGTTSASTSAVSSAAVASASGIATATAGITSAFYPSATGPYSTMVLGPNGAQIRLQLCEIVVSDEKNETNRYQVYRPVPEDQLLPLPHPQSLLTHRSHSSSTSVPAGGGSVFAALNQYNSLSYKQPLVAPRGSFLTDSRSSSIRFQDSSAQRSSVEESATAEGENGGSTQSSSPTKVSSPISGSLFIPPKVALVPPTPSPSSTASSNSATATVTSSTPTSPTTAPTTGPLVPGGSFFTRPPNRFRSPSSASARTTATTGTNGGDIMEMNDPGHLGRPVLVSIEPVQQQPLYSLYVPPPATTSTIHPHINKKSHPPLSPSAAIANANALHDDDDDDEDDSDGKENGDGDANATASDLLQTSGQDAQKEEEVEDGRRVLSEGGKPPKRKNLFLRLFQRPTAPLPSPPPTSNRRTNGAPVQRQQQQQQQTIPSGPPPPIPFHRTNHPTTRISEGEEEEDPEDMNNSHLKR
ncbi:magnesium transporter [Entomortierella parvispora]|uniref:Magnesium transporter n=1 Tax=Entomortierella parvispora TaxID=205924 RepID=A0A9P3LT99_9FUNG|nr:magnesium transporter [Entomortierella parvispora]